jgi:multidrug efflux pump subunit AcrA (membrane-fusion protein)
MTPHYEMLRAGGIKARQRGAESRGARALVLVSRRPPPCSAPLTGCDRGGDGAAEAAIPPPPPVTVAAPLIRRITEWYEFTGRFEAIESVEVRARVSGYVQSINFVDGELVE